MTGRTIHILFQKDESPEIVNPVIEKAKQLYKHDIVEYKISVEQFEGECRLYITPKYIPDFDDDKTYKIVEHHCLIKYGKTLKEYQTAPAATGTE